MACRLNGRIARLEASELARRMRAATGNGMGASYLFQFGFQLIHPKAFVGDAVVGIGEDQVG